MIDEKKLIEELEKIFETDEENIDCTLSDFAYHVFDCIKAQPKFGEWIPVSERLPNKEEYLKDDGRFMLDDGNRRYQGLFDIYDGKFKFTKHISGLNYELFEDNCVVAWMPLPEPYRTEKESEKNERI